MQSRSMVVAGLVTAGLIGFLLHGSKGGAGPEVTHDEHQIEVPVDAIPATQVRSPAPMVRSGASDHIASTGRVPRLERSSDGTAGVGASSPGSETSDATARTRSEVLESHFQDGEPDTDWSNAEQESISDLMETAGLDPSAVRSLDCRTQLCRLSLALPGAGDAARLQMLMKGTEQQYEVVPTLSAHSAAPEGPLGQDALAYVIYVAKPGVHVADVVGDAAQVE